MNKNTLELKELQVKLCIGIIDYLSDILEEEVEYSPEEETDGEEECVLEKCEDGSYIYSPDWEEDESLTFRDVLTDSQMRM